MDTLSRQEERSGFQGVNALGIGYFLFLILSTIWLRPFSLGILLNRLLSLLVFCWARWCHARQRIPSEHYKGWSLALGLQGLSSLAISHMLGFDRHLAVRITAMIVCGALVGVPVFYYCLYLAACLLTCICLQHWFPSPTDPEVNLSIPVVGLLLSLSIYTSRRRTGRLLHGMNEEVNQQRLVLEQTLARARRLGDSLDSDVARATSALQNTNEKLQQAIDEQVRTFEWNQRLQRETGDKLRYQALGKAAGAAAHDLNNLLAVISGSLETLEEELSGPGQAEPRQLVEELNQELSRCVQVGREVLALGGRYLVREEDFELGNWLERTVAALPDWLNPVRIRATPQAAWVRCDQSRLQTALLKLLSNAREAAPDSPIWLALELSGSHILLSIEDQGPGPSEKMLPVLFEPFSTDKNAYRHPGLGLAAARAILRQMGGDVLFQATSSGARFAIQLPGTSRV